MLLLLFRQKVLYYLYERVMMFNIHSKFYCCKILNVSNTKITHMLDFLDTSSMGVTFGIRAGRFRPCLGSLGYNKVVGLSGSG
jgi:hypothetical protein